MPRLSLTTELFRLTKNGKVFSVVDLSEKGMAVRVVDRTDLILFTVGSEIDGTLNLNREKYPVKASVRHIGTDLVGCEFKALKPELKKVLTRTIDPKTLGKELRLIPASEGTALWYHAPSGTDLLFWRNANDDRGDTGYRRFAIFVLGSFTQWEHGQGVTTGRTRPSFEAMEVRGVVRFETMLLDPDGRPDTGKLNVAKTLILSSNLPQELRKWCLRQLGA